MFPFALVAAAACHDSGPEPNADITLELLGGDGQTGPTGTTLPAPLRVRALRRNAAAPNVELAFERQDQTGAVEASAETGADGTAQVQYTIGGPGPQTITVHVSGGPASARFTVTGLASAYPALVGEVPIQPLYGIHDTFVRDGLAFVCAWNSGVIIYDVGDGRRGGSPSKPMEISRLVPPENGVPGGAAVHNAWWFHNPVSGEKRYLFLGQEGPGVILEGSSGDIHVIDVADLEHPAEVATLRIPGAGTHNFWMDEARQILYAAYYQAGVIALDVSGTLSGDLTSRIIAQKAIGGAGNTYTWGVMLAGGSLWASDMASGFWRLDPNTLEPLSGGNNVPERYGADLWVHGQYAYTGTWGGGARNGIFGDVVKIWSIAGGVVTLADSLKIPNVHTVSDVQVTDDGSLLVVTTERQSGQGLQVYDLANPTRPVLKGETLVDTGLHTGTVATIGGRLFVFTAKNPADPALRVYDITP